MAARPGRPIFVSPHPDDAVLSCGGTIAWLADAGRRPIVVTVFSGEVMEEMAGDLARWKHARWQMSDVDDVRRRRDAEDRAAAAAVGADPVFLGYPDAIYRGDRYQSDQELYGGHVVRSDQGLVELISQEVARLPGCTAQSEVFVPLAIGSHADHLLCFAAGESLARTGRRVLAWEDVP